MEVSVVIPVYNAAPFVEQAVLSALAQPETREILLVEDGSTDASLSICRRLAEQYPSIRLYQHPDGRHCGAGASRNAGIAQVACPLVAFLDADDYFMPGRFRKTLEQFAAHPDADGIYEDVGIFFEDEPSQQRAQAAGWEIGAKMGMRRRVEPADLFEVLAAGGAGSFHTDGIVVRRTLFEKSGLFNPDLCTGQDTHLWLRMAWAGRLYPGGGDVVGMCRIHANNRVMGRLPEHREDREDAYQSMWGDLILWAAARRLPKRGVHLLAGRYIAASKRLVMQKSLFQASGVARRACAYLIRNCPKPWGVDGVWELFGAASVVGLALQRLVHFVES